MAQIDFYGTLGIGYQHVPCLAGPFRPLDIQYNIFDQGLGVVDLSSILYSSASLALYALALLASVLVSGKHFKPSIIFAGKA